MPESTPKEKKEVFCSATGCERACTSRCSRCKISFYCSKECQSSAWKDHHQSECDNFLRLRGLAQEYARALDDGTARFQSQVKNMETILGRDAVADVMQAHDKTIELYLLNADGISRAGERQNTGNDDAEKAARRHNREKEDAIHREFDKEKTRLFEKYDDVTNIRSLINILNTKFALIDLDYKIKLRSDQIDKQGDRICARNKAG